MQERGLVERIGVSIYEASELEALPLEQLQLVQLPLSVYDQRMIKNGTIERLQSRGIAIHVRSIFLQGLILQPRDSWPIYISENFKAQHHKWQRQLSQENITPLAGALAFVQGCPGIEAVLVGVLSTKELQQVLRGWRQAMTINLKYSERWAWNDDTDLDPRLWPKQRP